jgi:lysine 2,3-aminomutase
MEGVDYIPSILLRAFGKDLRISKKRAMGTVAGSLRSRVFCNEFSPGTGVSEWSDCRWQLRNRIVDLNGVERLLNLSPDERCAIVSHNGTLPLAVTPYYAPLLARNDPMQPLRRTVVPVTAENILSLGESIDPLGEDEDSPVP